MELEFESPNKEFENKIEDRLRILAEASLAQHGTP